MKLRTEIQIPPPGFSLDHSLPMLSMGSCFADSMGKRLLDHKFPIQVNPLGILYNPYSIRKVLEAALNEDHRLADDLVEQDGRWHSFHFHSDLSHPDRETVAKNIREGLHFLRKCLLEARVVFFTYGTARVWKLKTSQEIVANCHKVPADRFTRELLQPQDLQLAWTAMLEKLAQLNPEVNLVLTVSPVRHVRDGLSENGLSKSILRLFCEALTQQYPFVHYFPAYEMMLDDLRDYRFYGPDLIHPNELAETYIWEKFSRTYFSENTQQLVSDWQKAKRSLAHRSFSPHSEKHQAFLRQLIKQLETLNESLNCAAEIAEVKAQLEDKA